VSTTTTEPADLAAVDARRVEAIEESGWGAEFTLFQPRNLAFWVWLIPVVWGVLYFLNDTLSASSYYGPALSLAMVVFALYGAFFWWLTQVADRYSSQPAKLRVVAFLWGGFAATWIMSLPANNALRSIYAKLFGQGYAMDWGPSSAVWFTEEWSKGFGLLLLIALAPRLVRTAFDGLILGAFLGLGFQILENVSYIKSAAATGWGADQLGSSVQTFLMRMTTGIAGHFLFTGVFCAGLVYVLGRPAEPRRLGRGLLLMSAAMVIHFVWDSEAAIAHVIFGDGVAAGIAAGGLLVGLPLLALAVLAKVFSLTVANERSFMPAMLEPEVARGVMTDAEVQAASGTRKDRRRYRHSGGGTRRRRQLLETVFDLAHELGASGGVSTPRVEFARSEVLRLRGLVAG